MGQFFTILSQKSQDQLSIIWSIRSFQKFYKDAPLDYFAYLIAHEGQNSLFSVLREEGLITDLSADVEHELRVMSTFIISCDLTEKGYEEKDRVIEYIYAYLGMLKREGINYRCFEEIQAKRKLLFEYMEKADPFYFCSTLASKMHYYPPKDILVHPFLMNNFREDLLLEGLKRLVPERSRVFMYSNKVKEQCNETEYFYKIHYS